MPSLTSGLKLGTGSVSSLVKSASSLATQLATYQDAVQAYQYELSAKTDSDLATYQTYLNGRITTLNNSGTLTDASKSLTLTKALSTAVKANITASIQYENIQVMAGNASDQDKLNLIQTQFQRSVANGDMAEAQTLESQAYSLSQTIQLKAQTAADAAATLAKSAASASATTSNTVATTLEDSLKDMNTKIGQLGAGDVNKALKDYAASQKANLTNLANATTDPGTKAAIMAATKSQPNYADVVAGTTAAMVTAHYLAYQAELPIDPNTAQGYLESATNIANGTTKVDTLAGSLTINQIQQWQQNPSMFVPHEDVNSGRLTFSYNDPGKPSGSSAITGFKIDSKGNVTANFSGQAAGQAMTSQEVTQTTATLKKLGLSYDTSAVKTSSANTNGIAVQFNDKVAKFLQPLAAGQKNLETRAYVTPQGLQLATIDASGQGHVYLVATDNSGKQAVYKSTGAYANGNPIFGKQVASGEYGFNQNQNSLWQAPSASTKNSLSGGLKAKSPGLAGIVTDVGTMLGLEHSAAVNSIVTKANETLNKIVATRQANDAKITAQANATLAAAHAQQFGATSTPAPHAAPIPIAPPTIKPVNAPTVNPQGNNVNPQTGAGDNSAGSFKLPSLGTGIKL